MAIRKKYSKLIVKDASGNLIQLLPEVKVDDTLDSSSNLPISNSAVAEAIEELQNQQTSIADCTIDVSVSDIEMPVATNVELLSNLTTTGHINVAWKSDFDDSSTKTNYAVTQSVGRYFNSYNTLYDEANIIAINEGGAAQEIKLSTFDNANWEDAFYINNASYGIIHKTGFDGIYYTVNVNAENTSGYVFKLLSFADTNNFTSGTYSFCSKAESLGSDEAPDVYIIGQVHIDFVPTLAEAGITTIFTDANYKAINRYTFYITYKLCSKEYFDYFNKYNITVSLNDGTNTISAITSLPDVNYRIMKLEERIHLLEFQMYNYVLSNVEP